MSEVKVSVIIPVFNVENYLRRCVDSVLGQTFPEPYEIILVDDGSSDGSGAICDEYSGKCQNVKVFHTANQGASLARRLGLEESAGDWVTFIDSDDYVEKDYVGKLLDMAVKTGCGVASCGIRVAGQAALKQGTDKVVPFDELMPRFFRCEFWGLWAKIYKRSLLMAIPFPGATLSEDYLINARVFEKERRLPFISEPLYVNCRREGSLSRQPLSSRSFEEFDNVSSVFDFTRKTMPEYSPMALANATGTVVKLLRYSRPNASALTESRKLLKSFLRRHYLGIATCGALAFKTKLLALLYAF